MKATESFQEYCAIKAHFERPSYDYYKYNGKVRAGNYDKRKDKSFFFRLSRAYNTKELHEYYIANFLAGQAWVGNMNKDHWVAWKRKMVRLPEVFAEDMQTLNQLVKERELEIKDLFRYESGEHPIIFRLLMGDFIQIESFILLAQMIKFHKAYDRQMKDDPIWAEWSNKIHKYGIILSKEYARDINGYTKIAIANLLNTP